MEAIWIDLRLSNTQIQKFGLKQSIAGHATLGALKTTFVPFQYAHPMIGTHSIRIWRKVANFSEIIQDRGKFDR